MLHESGSAESSIGHAAAARSTSVSIDLRSDTVTRPDAEMRRAMAEAVVGDDVYEEDPTVQDLERRVASLLGKESGLFVSSGTQGNLVAILARAGRGDQMLIGDSGHSFLYEAGGPSAFAGVQTHALAVQPDGTLDLEQIRGAVHPGDLHHARTVLLVLENTKDGRVLPLDYLEEVEELLVHLGLGAHLDGARLFNAAAYLEVPPSRLTRPFETVTVCLSKGLGAPVGSVLCGSAELIGRARRWRKMLGGGMRQVGVLAAAGLVALERRDALKRDHAMAQQLSDALSRLEVDVQVHRCATNMIYLSLPLAMSEVEEMRSALGSVGVVWPGGTAVGDRCWFRLVTHRDLPADAVQRVSEALDSFSRGLLQQRQPAAQAR